GRSVRQYFSIVYKRLPIILAITLIVTSAVALYMFKQPHEYMATAQMIIEPPKPKVTDKDSININFGLDVNYSNTQLQLLRSPELMKNVVINLGLYRDPDLLGRQNRGLIAGLRSIFWDEKNGGKDNLLPVIGDVPSQDNDKTKVILTPEEDTRAETYGAILLGGLTVEPVERTNLVNINIKNENPDLAARVADEVAQLFKKEDADRQTAGSRQAFEDLKKSIESLNET